MLKVLIVEDSAVVTKVLRHLVDSDPQLQAEFVDSLAAAQSALAQTNDYFAAIVDLTLPDARDGEAVDFTLAQGLPTIVLTGVFDPQMRERLQSRGIVDYITKENRYSYQRALALVHRLARNRHTQVVVAEDSSSVRRHIVTLLERHHYRVHQATNGREALALLTQHPQTRLLITDYQMPEVDGFTLTQELRHRIGPDRLAIIGLSTSGEPNLSARFIKYGADDFLHKPFCPEEFYCRVQSNIEALERLMALEESARRDPLTGLHNRRHFFAEAPGLLSQAQSQGHPLAVAVLDVDHFKKINDHYGHQTGDEVLKALAQALSQGFARFLLARAGGEEFFLMMPGVDSDKGRQLLDSLRTQLARHPLRASGEAIPIRFSAGITDERGLDLEQMLAQADRYLYQAKAAGRDRVVDDSCALQPA
ncbi:diguanylate cyclase [Ferrimonas balearica]|uniref:diguanylate cyclase n=1 Tax=Ferrimonas balearica TaxID=44012 RepID=UPI001C991DE4|nr:diguanylate cyclase [Ferrimonas balearica]MBY5992532.1 diguanylate cyclase [Ferrimonas balearica]